MLAHREELLEQACRKVLATNPGIRVGLEQAERRATTTCEYVVASVATLGRYQSPRLLRLDPSRFSLVITEEAHHMAQAFLEHDIPARPRRPGPCSPRSGNRPSPSSTLAS